MSVNPDTAAPGGSEMTERVPYTLWRMDCPFRKTGSPITGNIGSTYRSVVIMETAEFQRMLRDHPSLTAEDVKFNLGSFE
jgi:hypothetical protein